MRNPTNGAMRQESQPQPFAGFGNLLRFMIRRDRLRAPVWVVSVVGIIVASAASVIGLYDTPFELQQYADLAQADAALKAIAGPGYGLDNPTTGAVVMNETLLYTLIGTALMCIFLLVRHTRAEEETDRAELVRAASVGRLATLSAACVWVATITIVVAAGIMASFVALGLATTGTLAFGAIVAGTGLLFIGIAAVMAQVASSARAATAGAGVALGVSFVMRAVGDLGTGWVTWLSPLGWAQSIRAFDDERWWVLAPIGLTTLALMAVAVMLSVRRDLGAGLLAQRAGPARGNPRLATPLAMAARLQRTSLISWMVGLSLLGFFFGIVADQADLMLENEAIAEFFKQAGAGTPTDAFLATIVLMIGLIASGFTVSAVLRLRTEELAGRAGLVLATPVSRTRWLLSYLAVTAGGTVAVMMAAGLATGLGYAAQIGDIGKILPVLGAAAAMLPALLVLAAVSVALIGIRPGWAPLAWIGVALSAVVGVLAETLKLPQALRNVSPFEHIPAIPAASLQVLPLAMLCAVAALFVGVGLLAMGRRDIT